MPAPAATATTLAVELRGLTKDYRSGGLALSALARLVGRPRAAVAAVRALDGVTLAVPAGEIVGLLGPNGGGKTTALKCILGLLRPTSGEVSVFGRPPTDLAAKARIGFLPEESTFPPFLTAEETVRFFGRLSGLSGRDLAERIPRLLETVGLEARDRRRKLRELSKGMQRRVGLAQALVAEPDLLVLDEPGSGLDPLGSRDLRRLLEGERTKGRTVLLSSHRLSDAEAVCDRAAILHRGRILACASVRDLTEGGRRTLEQAFFAHVEGAAGGGG